MNRARIAAWAAAAVATTTVLTSCSSTVQVSSSSPPTGTAAATTAAPSDGPSAVTPLTVVPIGDPLHVPGSDGKQHIDYDLLISNVFTVPVTLTSVEVRGDNGTPVLTLQGGALAGVTESPFLQKAVDPAAQVPVSGSVTVEIDVILPAGRLPAKLDHVVKWSVPADAPALAVIGSSTGQVAGPTLSVSPVEPVVIAAPLKGDGWTSLQGCCVPNGHRSLRYGLDGSHLTKAEMFAVDWIRLQNGFWFTGDGSTVEQYPYLRSDLLAAADGTVVKVRDGMPNETPNEPPRNVKQPQDYVGNSVVIQIAPDRYAIYAHIDPGTITVKVGDKVTTGQTIGKLGSSGNSTAPHLHFAITDNADFLAATSIPFVIDNWTLQGTTSLDALGTPPGPVTLSGSPTPQSKTHPLYLTVGTFG